MSSVKDPIAVAWEAFLAAVKADPRFQLPNGNMSGQLRLSYFQAGAYYDIFREAIELYKVLEGSEGFHYVEFSGEHLPVWSSEEDSEYNSTVETLWAERNKRMAKRRGEKTHV